MEAAFDGVESQTVLGPEGAEMVALGTAMVVNHNPFTIVGVSPPGFHLPYHADLWSPV